MTSDRDTRRIVRAWLGEGVTALPDRVLDEVLDRVPQTRQRRGVWWRVRPLLYTNRSLAVAVAATAVMVVAYLGFGVVAPSGVGDDPLAPVPSASPSKGVQALPDGVVPLQAGMYSIDRAFPARITIDVPEGWSSCTDESPEPALCGDAGAALAFFRVQNVVADPCDPDRALLEPPVGPSVDDLVAAIANLDGFESSEPIDVTIDGFHGKRFELTAPLRPGCAFGNAGLGTWTSAAWTNGVSPAESNQILILDLDGERVMIAGASQPTTPLHVRDQMTEMIDSIQLDR